ncbi:MAG: ribosomal protein S18-alanine N-acetyltransferase, partial [Candidatus Aenigmarchaeota archaeon]|nr:ribosomal protein S18-alanine N-acetyltransferase [Candidatus Aenigmarchaeota archaeon]
MEIRKAKPSDIPEIRAIELETFPPAETFSYGFFHLMTTHVRPFLVSSDPQGVLQGYILAVPREDFVHIISVAVKPEFQGRGIGKKLLASLIELMQKEGYNYFRLELRKSNERAYQLYWGFNFRPIGIRKNYYVDGEDAIIMEMR